MQKLLHSILLLSTLVSSNFISGATVEQEQTKSSARTDVNDFEAVLKKDREDRNKSLRWLFGGIFGAVFAVSSLEGTYKTSVERPSNGLAVGFFGALTGLSAIFSCRAFWKFGKINKMADEEMNKYILQNVDSVRDKFNKALDKCDGKTNCESKLMVGACLDSFLRIKKNGNTIFDKEIASVQEKKSQKRATA